MQSQNFEFLRKHWPELASLGGFSERYAYPDPEGAMVKLRAYGECLVGAIYKAYTLPRQPMSTFMDLLKNSAFTASTPKVILEKLHALRIYGNKAAHGEKVTAKAAVQLVKEAYDLGRWIYITTAKGDVQSIPPYSPPSKEIDDTQKIKKEKSILLEKYARQESQMQALLTQLQQERQQRLEAQKTAEELREIAAKAEQVADELAFDEETTRRFLIDSQLADVGWHLKSSPSNQPDVVEEMEVEYQPTNSGKGYADYVLPDDDGKPLAVIEAKKTAIDPETGRTQASDYADGLEKRYNQRPVIFYSNGFDTWIWDDAQNYPPRKIYGFYSKDSLQYLVHQRREKKPLDSLSPNQDIAGRLYQLESIKRVTERFADNHRKALIVQATGTGKTRVAIALTDLLIRAGWVKRVLFLCDRRELRKQAKNAYSNFLREPITVLSTSNVQATENRIYLATYPAMLRIFQRFDVGFFDLIIADESHRSIYNIYGDIFHYFDALQVGLTATPVEMVSRSTCRLFGCDYKHPTADYPLERAVEENYLVPYQVVKHTTKFLREGIKEKALSKEQIAELEDQGIDPNTLDFDAKDIDKYIYNKDTNRIILRNLMEQGIRDATGQTVGKSIIFARNHQHAVLLEKLFNDIYPQYGGKFCQVIDNYDPRAEELIDDFKGDGKNDQLTIAISVDMLDTGIDIPEVVNLVFAKPVKSPVKFWQMIGRGTRLCEDQFGPGKHKTHFLIFDHWGVVAYHGAKQREVEIHQSKSLLQQVFESRLELAKTALKAGVTAVFDNSANLLLENINSLNERSIAVREKWKLKRQLGRLEVLKQFAPNTVVALEQDIAPLMQWVDIRGASDAYRFDLLIAQLIKEKLLKSALEEDLKGQILNWLNNLQMHLNPVKEKLDELNQARQSEFWKTATFEQIEEVRRQLRDIVKYKEKQGTEPLVVPVTDIRDGEIQIEKQTTHLKAVDMRAYQAQVEEVLKKTFEQEPVLQKIRKGEPVSAKELESLNSLVHTQNPDVDLSILQEFYESATGLDQILRSIVGMDAEAVKTRFEDFVHHYPQLSAKQIRFLSLLQSHIARFGCIELKTLYEAPFTMVDSAGLDGVFDNEQQIDTLVSIIRSFGEKPVPKTVH